jgi:hypothetical protein
MGSLLFWNIDIYDIYTHTYACKILVLPFFFFNLQSVDVRILHIEFLNVDHHFTVCILHLRASFSSNGSSLVLCFVTFSFLMITCRFLYLKLLIGDTMSFGKDIQWRKSKLMINESFLADCIRWFRKQEACFTLVSTRENIVIHIVLKCMECNACFIGQSSL